MSMPAPMLVAVVLVAGWPLNAPASPASARASPPSRDVRATSLAGAGALLVGPMAAQSQNRARQLA